MTHIPLSFEAAIVEDPILNEIEARLALAEAGGSQALSASRAGQAGTGREVMNLLAMMMARREETGTAPQEAPAAPTHPDTTGQAVAAGLSALGQAAGAIGGAVTAGNGSSAPSGSSAGPSSPPTPVAPAPAASPTPATTSTASAATPAPIPEPTRDADAPAPPPTETTPTPPPADEAAPRETRAARPHPRPAASRTPRTPTPPPAEPERPAPPPSTERATPPVSYSRESGRTHLVELAGGAYANLRDGWAYVENLQGELERARELTPDEITRIRSALGSS